MPRQKSVLTPAVTTASGDAARDNALSVGRDETQMIEARDATLKAIEQLTAARPVARIEQQADFTAVEFHLAKVKTIQKAWDATKEQIYRPLKNRIDRINELYAACANPLEAEEKWGKDQIADYRRREEARKKAEEAARIVEQRRLEAEAQRAREEAARAAQAADVDAQLDALDRAHYMQGQAALVQANAVTQEVLTTTSSARTYKRAKVTSVYDLVVEVYHGRAPVELLMVDQVALNKLYKEDPAKVESWECIEIEEKPQIASRGL